MKTVPILTCLLTGVIFASNPAHALVIDVADMKYEVSVFTGSYEQNKAKFETYSNSGLMPWWGNGDLASEFARLVNYQFGNVNNPPWSHLKWAGPYFAFNLRTPFFNNDPPPSVEAQFIAGFSGLNDSNLKPFRSYTWAQASRVVQVPAPMPCLGIAVALKASRRLKILTKRLQQASAPKIIIYSGNLKN